MFNHSKTTKGLSVVTYNMPAVNTISINLIVKVGSRHEKLEENGISHFLEHMAFKGTKNFTALEIAKEFDAIGGHFNAYTSRENTVYFAKVLHNHSQKALTIIADIVQNSIFAENEIKKELEVITQEIAEIQDSPDDLIYEKFYELAYPSQQVGRPIIGKREIIEKFTRNNFVKYTEKNYVAKNMTLSVAGRVNHQEVAEFAENIFSSLNNGEGSGYDRAEYIGGEYFKEKDLEQTSILIGFCGPSYLSQKEYYHAQILSVIFGGGLSSRLFQRIREDLGLAYHIGSSYHALSDTGLFIIGSACDHNRSEELIANIKSEIVNIQVEITEDELQRAKSQIEASIYMADEKPESKSEEIGKNFSVFKQYFDSQEIISEINKTTSSDLTKIAIDIFSTNSTIAQIGKK